MRLLSKEEKNSILSQNLCPICGEKIGEGGRRHFITRPREGLVEKIRCLTCEAKFDIIKFTGECFLRNGPENGSENLLRNVSGI